MKQVPLLCSIDLSENYLEAVPEIVSSSIVLEDLNLSNNLMKKIDAKLLTNCAFTLTVLDMHSNSLTGTAFDDCCFTGLKILNISNNSLTKVAENIAKSFPHLLTLDASRNKIASIGNLPKSLKSLNFSKNLIKIPTSNWHELTNLIKLDFSANQISELPSNWKNFASHLKELDLCWNPLNLNPKTQSRGLKHILSCDNFSSERMSSSESSPRFKIPPLAANVTKSPVAKVQPNNIKTFRKSPESSSQTSLPKSPKKEQKKVVISSDNFPARRRNAVENYKKVTDVKKLPVRHRSKSRSDQNRNQNNSSNVRKGTSNKVSDFRDYLLKNTSLKKEAIETDAGLMESISDGILLCRLVNQMKPGAVKTIHVKSEKQKVS